MLQSQTTSRFSNPGNWKKTNYFNELQGFGMLYCFANPSHAEKLGKYALKIFDHTPDSRQWVSVNKFLW